MLSVLGLQSSKGLSNLDYDKIIHRSRSIVKQIKSEISANDEEKIEYKSRSKFCLVKALFRINIRHSGKCVI